MKKKKTYKIAIIDMFLVNYHFADVYGEEWRYAWLTGGPYPYDSYETVVAMADRLFWAFNPLSKTQEEWIEGGTYDVRVYDNSHSCLYRACEKLPKE